MKMMKNFSSSFKTSLKVTALAACIATTVTAMTGLIPAYAETSAVNETTATSNLNQYLSRINSLEASFVQTTQATSKAPTRPMANQTLKSTHLNQKFTGTMQVKRPGQFRWETASPSRQVITTTGQTVWIYDPDLEQAVRQKLDEQVGNTPALLLSGQASSIMKSFKVTQPNAGEPYFVLYPKSDDGVFESLGIRFNNNAPSQMILKDSLGQQTTINFSNVKLNPAINSSVFNFTPPKGTDVIDQ